MGRKGVREREGKWKERRKERESKTEQKRRTRRKKRENVLHRPGRRQ
jgi:hypothetical protein